MNNMYINENTLDFILEEGSLISSKYEVNDIMFESFVDTFFNKFGKSANSKKEFKKIYKFKPLDNSHPDIGKITFKDGREYIVDLEETSMVTIQTGIKDAEVQVNRSTMATLSNSDGKIFIDRSFWDLSKSEQEYVLSHEIGHVNMHSINMANKNLNGKFIRISSLLSITRTSLEDKMGRKVAISEFKIFLKLFGSSLLDGVRKYLQQAISNESKFSDDDLEKIRKDIIQKYVDEYYDLIKKSGEPVENDHLNISEIEADVFASNASSNKSKNQVSKSLNKLYDNYTKDINAAEKKNEQDYKSGKISKADYEATKHNIEKARLNVKQGRVEAEIRQKAANDERLRNSDNYKLNNK